MSDEGIESFDSTLFRLSQERARALEEAFYADLAMRQETERKRREFENRQRQLKTEASRQREAKRPLQQQLVDLILHEASVTADILHDNNIPTDFHEKYYGRKTLLGVVPYYSDTEINGWHLKKPASRIVKTIKERSAYDHPESMARLTVISTHVKPGIALGDDGKLYESNETWAKTLDSEAIFPLHYIYTDGLFKEPHLESWRNLFVKVLEGPSQSK